MSQNVFADVTPGTEIIADVKSNDPDEDNADDKTYTIDDVEEVRGETHYTMYNEEGTQIGYIRVEGYQPRGADATLYVMGQMYATLENVRLATDDEDESSEIEDETNNEDDSEADETTDDETCANCGASADTVDIVTSDSLCRDCAESGVEVMTDGGRPEGWWNGNALYELEEGDTLGVAYLAPHGLVVDYLDVEEIPSQGVPGAPVYARDSDGIVVRVESPQGTTWEEDDRVGHLLYTHSSDPDRNDLPQNPERERAAWEWPVIAFAYDVRDDLQSEVEEWLIRQGATCSEAKDYMMAAREVGGTYTQEEWADHRGLTSHQSISQQVRSTRSLLTEYIDGLGLEHYEEYRLDEPEPDALE